MKTHAVKEPITDNTLFVEVEPQIFYDDGFMFVDKPQYFMSAGWLIKHHSPIAIGDTVYQGEEWCSSDEQLLDTDHSPQTMPIGLADKTFKVVGIEVSEKDVAETIMGETRVSKDGRFAVQPANITIKEKWFWSYKLKEIV